MAQWKFKHSRQHYAQTYGISERTVSRMVQRGFPLDDEPAMRVYIAQGAKLPASEPVKGSREIPSGSNESGLKGSIERLRQAELAAHVAYTQAAREGNIQRSTSLQRDWLSLTEQLRKVEQSNPEIEEQNKKTIRLEDLTLELNVLFVRLRQDLETLPKRIALELVSKDEIGIREILSREIDDVILSLYQCKYLKEAERGE